MKFIRQVKNKENDNNNDADILDLNIFKMVVSLFAVYMMSVLNFNSQLFGLLFVLIIIRIMLAAILLNCFKSY